MPPKNNPNNRVRMRDVANRCGVSISTVSLVLSGDPRIPEDTVRKVLQAVKALEYRPSVVARNLARRSSRTIGVILPEFAFIKNRQFYYQALSGIHEQTQPAGYKLVVEAASKGFLERRYYHRLLKEQSADAMIYLAASLGDTFLGEMKSEPYPFVLVGNLASGVDLPAVKGGDFEAAKMATKHLIDLGHKQIAHITGIQSTTHGFERKRGYTAAMKESNLPIKDDWMVSGEFDTFAAERTAAQLAQAGVTAVMAASDSMAFGVIRGLKKQGKKIPKDVSVVAIDDVATSEWIDPELTTVRYDITTLASVAAKYVINKLKSPLIKEDVLNDVPQPKLILRGSTGENK